MGNANAIVSQVSHRNGARPIVVNVSLTPMAGEVIVGAFLMNTALTTQIPTRASAMRVPVPHDCRGSRRVIQDYPIPDGQEESV